MEAVAIRRAFGAPSDVLERDGIVRGLTYPCEDARGEVLELRMVFDTEGRLAKCALGPPGGTGPKESGG